MENDCNANFVLYCKKVKYFVGSIPASNKYCDWYLLDNHTNHITNLYSYVYTEPRLAKSRKEFVIQEKVYSTQPLKLSQNTVIFKTYPFWDSNGCEIYFHVQPSPVY